MRLGRALSHRPVDLFKTHDMAESTELWSVKEETARLNYDGATSDNQVTLVEDH